jgi:hypothetical protein
MRILLLVLSAILWSRPALSQTPTPTPTPIAFACPEPWNPYVYSSGKTYAKLGADLFIPTTGSDLTGTQWALGNASIRPYVLEALKRQLNQLSSSGGRTIRIFITHMASGFPRATFDQARTEESAQIVNDYILPMLEAYGMRADVAFMGNSYFWALPWGTGRWFEASAAPPATSGYRYGASVEGFHAFADDLSSWENVWIAKAESLSNHNVIFYYDVFNELDFANNTFCQYGPNNQRIGCCNGNNDTVACADCSNSTSCTYNGPVSSVTGSKIAGTEDRDYLLRKLLRMPALPDSKRGISLLNPCTGTNLVSAAQTSAAYPSMAAVSIAMVDTHSYAFTNTTTPSISCPSQGCANPNYYPSQCDLDVGQKIGLAKLTMVGSDLTKFACPIIGEFATPQCTNAMEQTPRRPNSKDLYASASKAGLGSVLAWTFWDRDVGASGTAPVGEQSCDRMTNEGGGILESISVPKPTWEDAIDTYPMNLLWSPSLPFGEAGGSMSNKAFQTHAWNGYVAGTNTPDPRVHLTQRFNDSGETFLRMKRVKLNQANLSVGAKLCTPFVKLPYTSATDRYGNSLRKYRAAIDGRFRGRIGGNLSVSVEGGNGPFGDGTCCTTPYAAKTSIQIPLSTRPKEWTTWSAKVPLGTSGYPHFDLTNTSAYPAEYARVCFTTMPKTGLLIAPDQMLDIDNLTFNVW